MQYDTPFRRTIRTNWMCNSQLRVSNLRIREWSQRRRWGRLIEALCQESMIAISSYRGKTEKWVVRSMLVILATQSVKSIFNWKRHFRLKGIKAVIPQMMVTILKINRNSINRRQYNWCWEALEPHFSIKRQRLGPGRLLTWHGGIPATRRRVQLRGPKIWNPNSVLRLWAW